MFSVQTREIFHPDFGVFCFFFFFFYSEIQSHFFVFGFKVP